MDAALLEQVLTQPLVAGAPLGDALVHDAQAARAGVGRVATAGTFASRGQRSAAEAERRLYGDLGSPIDTRLDIVLHRRLSRPLSRTAVALGISPNAITVASGIVGLARRRCVALGAPAALIGGLLLYVLAVVLDHADGEVARLTLTESALGEWLDVVADTVVHTTLVLALGRRRQPAGRRGPSSAWSPPSASVVSAIIGKLWPPARPPRRATCSTASPRATASTPCSRSSSSWRLSRPTLLPGFMVVVAVGSHAYWVARAIVLIVGRR